MKIRTIVLILVVVGALFLVTSCDELAGLLGGTSLDESQRVAAFLDDANASPRDPVVMQANFSSDANEYSSMNLDSWWGSTFFADGDQPFTVSDLVDGGAMAAYNATSSLTGTITSANSPATNITFAFVADPMDSANMLIRAIEVDGYDLIQKVR